MHYNESSIAALHQVRSERLYGTADAGTARRRGLGFRTLLARARQALGIAPSPQPVHNG